MSRKNLISRAEVNNLVNRLRRAGKKIVFTNGVFDILHRGHIEYLAKAKSCGDVLIVGLNTDASVRRIKGWQRPIQKQQDRAAILLALKAVDYVVLFGEDTPDKLIRMVKPDVLVKGADWRLSQIAGADFVRSYGGKVKRVKLSEGHSTSAIIKKLNTNLAKR
ncbi:MAG: D-glycero-beta-D-manno-heptose 1-phosphate adenylyltransferase [Candidatus Zixiibacteriota bacterium]